MKIRPYSRSERYGHELKKILSEIILKEVATSEIGFVTISQVKVSRDLKYARVYVSIVKRDVTKERVEDFFSKEAKHIRGILGSKITTRSVPDLKFFYDETYEEVEKLDRLFAKIEQPRKVTE